jgi:4-amino-4-deoxy-L-arabinose transferase-like glycosyltransferase
MRLRPSSNLMLLVILLIGAALRFAFLWRDAPPLYADEIEQYVSMHSIVNSGTDIDGKLQPFLDCRLGRNPPIYGIVGYLSTLALGNSTFGWRFPAAVFGLIAIVLVFLIVRELTRRDAIALGAALLFAIEPNQIHFSRIGWEPATVLPCLLCGAWILLVALRDPGRPLSFPLLVAGALVLGLSPYTYPLTSIYALLLVGSLFILRPAVFRDKRNCLKLCAAGILAAAIAAPGLRMATTDPHTLDRTSRVFTFAHGVTRQSLEIFVHNYISHFGWPYLFETGSHNPRYLSGYGALHWWYGPLILLGAVYAGNYVRPRALCWWLWIWVAIYPLGGALTNDRVVPYATRTIAGSPVFAIFAAIGAYALLTEGGRLLPTLLIRRRFQRCVLAVLAVCVIGSTWSFSNYYFRVYPIVSARAWESGAREAFAAVRVRERGYGRLCVVGFDYYHVESLERYFLANTPLTLIEGLKRPECRTPSTLLLSTSRINIPGFYVVDAITSLDGRLFAVLEARGGEQPKGMSSQTTQRRSFSANRPAGPT